MQSPKLAGRWAIVGSAVGKGAVYGTVVIAADPGAPDNFTTDARYTVARTGETVTRTGKAIVYTGYQWRGRGGDAQPWREVLFVERDWRNMWGRWYTGSYDETGIDEYALQWSVKEYKKTRVRSFTDDWDEWRAAPGHSMIATPGLSCSRGSPSPCWARCIRGAIC